MDVEPIQTEAGYEAALLNIEQYFDKPPVPGSPEAKRFDALASAIATYESARWPLDARGPATS